jgi:hypothetical protein
MNFQRSISAIAGVILVLSLTPAMAQTTLTWKGTVSTDWNNPSNWSPTQAPTAIDHVIIGSGSVAVPATGVFNVMDWNGGNISGVLNVGGGATLNIGATVYLDAALTNNGTVNWKAGDINVAYQVSTGGPFVNQLGATWNISCDNEFTAAYSAGYPTYPNAYAVNAGLVRKTAGSGVTEFGGFLYAAPFINLGTVEADLGTIQFDSSGMISGAYTATNVSSVIQFNHGNYGVTNATMTGPGVIEFTGDSLTLSNDVIANLKLLGGKLFLGPAFQGGTITNLTIAGVTLQGNYTVSGILNWNGGNISGVLNVGGGATLNIGATVYLDAALTNNGTVNWKTGDINVAYQVSTGGPFVNQLGATWNISCDNFFGANSSAGYPTYPNAYAVNAGLVRKTTTSGTTEFGGALYGAPFRNSGTVEADSGTIEFFNSAMLAGTYTATSASSVIQFGHGNYTATNFIVSGAGTVKFTGDSLTLSNDVIANLKMLSGNLLLGPLFQEGTITNLTIAGVTLQGNYIVIGVLNCVSGGTAGSLAVGPGGFLNWMAGDISGSLTVSNNAVLSINGAVYLDAALTNSGTINWTNGNVYMAYTVSSAGPVVNLPGGIWNIQCDYVFSTDFGAGYPTYPNAYIVNQGLFRKTANTGVTEIGYRGAYTVLFKNSGNVEADAGTLSFEGGYQDNGSGILVFAPAGLASTNYGLISFSSIMPAFSGPLNLSLSPRNGFQFSPNQWFSILSFPSATNWISCLNGLDLGNGILFQPQITATTLSLLATIYATNSPTPQLFITPTLDGVSVTWPDKFSAWTLQSATNLLSSTWSPISACEDNALVPVSGPKQFFRLTQ